MRTLLTLLCSLAVGAVPAADPADAIQTWETQTGGLPRDPNERVVDPPDGMKLVLLVGQSNMAGRADVPDEERKPLPNAYKLNRDDKWVAATSPFHFDRATAGIGPANAFVKRYLAEHPNETVGIVPCAVGGSRSATWDPDGTGLTGANFRRALLRAKVAKSKGRFVAILWHQGESDMGAPAEELKKYYPDRFRRMVEAFRREVGDVPVVLGEVGWFLGEGAVKINSVLNILPQGVSRCRCVSSKGLKNRDQWHFDLNSVNELGTRYYKAFEEVSR